MNQQIDLTIMKQKICYFSLEMCKHFSNKVKKTCVLLSSEIPHSYLWLSGALLLVSLAQDVEGLWELLSLDNDLFLFCLSLVLDLCLIEGDTDLCLTEGDLQCDVCIFLFAGTSGRLIFPEEKQDNKLGKTDIKYIAQNKTIFNLEVTMRPSTRVCYLTNFQSNLIANFIRWIPYPKDIHRTLTKNVNKTSEI